MSACGCELTKNVIIIIHLPHRSSFGKRHAGHGEMFGFGLIKCERENSSGSIPWNVCQRRTLVRAQWVRLTKTPHHTHTLPPCSGCRLMRFEVFLLFSTSSPDGQTFGLVILVRGPLKFSSGTVWHHHFKDKLASCDVLTCENKYATLIQP